MQLGFFDDGEIPIIVSLPITGDHFKRDVPFRPNSMLASAMEEHVVSSRYFRDAECAFFQ